MFNTWNSENIEKPISLKQWKKVNLVGLAIGLTISTSLVILMSLIKGQWISTRQAIFHYIFGIIISIFVCNGLLLSKKFWAKKGNGVVQILIYYAFSLGAVFIAIEVIYLLLAAVLKTPYTFFHKDDFLFSCVLTIIVNTVMYVHNAQKVNLNNRIKEKELALLRLNQMKTEAELATLHSKINPHFLYNSLNAIASLIHVDPDKAEGMTLKLSKLFRYSINQTQENLVSVTEEIEIVNTYLEIEKVRFGDRISFKTDLDPALNREKIPRFLIQPLVENALKHGLKNVLSHGMLRISIKKTELMEIIIEDNGSPFPEELEIGYGLQSTYDKLNLLYGSNNYEVQILNYPNKQLRIQFPVTYD
jgi:sensor histidine kinase YesM